MDTFQTRVLASVSRIRVHLITNIGISIHIYSEIFIFLKNSFTQTHNRVIMTSASEAFVSPTARTMVKSRKGKVSHMIPAIRQEKIMDMLSDQEIVSTEELMQSLDISVSTLRRDLMKLEQEHKIHLLHGGGVRRVPKSGELTIAAKLDLNKDRKERIAKKAASYVADGDVIFLDPSSTTFHMIPYLAGKKITVVTNGLSHINQLIIRDIPCMMIGGSIKKTTNACIGPIAENTMHTLFFSKCFLGASGFSIASGITNHDINERVIKLLALRNSTQPYFLLDHSKFGTITLIKVADLDEYPIFIDEIPSELSGYRNFISCE